MVCDEKLIDEEDALDHLREAHAPEIDEELEDFRTEAEQRVYQARIEEI